MKNFNKKLFLILSLFSCLYFALFSLALADEGELVQIADKVLSHVSQIRELEPIQDIPIKFKTREEYKQELGEQLENIPDKQWESLEQIYRALHLLPEGVTAREVAEAFHAEAVLAYYDTTKKEITIIGEDARLEKILAHEFAHALAHQHFPQTFQIFSQSSDQEAALRALLEGDASLVEEIYNQLYLASSEAVVNPATSELKEIVDIPPGITLFYLFPYIGGLNFVHQLWELEGWEAVNRAYLSPPQSSEQIIHPEKYGVDEPEEVEIPVASSGEWEILAEDRLGEFSLFTMLWNQGVINWDLQNPYLSPLSDGWEGDQILIYKSEEGYGYIWGIVWETERDASEFLSGYNELLKAVAAIPIGGDVWQISSDNFIKAWQQEDKTIIVNAPSFEAIQKLTGLIQGRVKGRVQLQGAIYHDRVEVEISGKRVTTDRGGNFSLDVASGRHRLKISKPGYLSAEQEIEVKPWEETLLPSFTLLAGDGNGDGRVDIADLIQIAEAFNTKPPFPSTLDFTQDGIVDIYDLVLVGKNFGMKQSS